MSRFALIHVDFTIVCSNSVVGLRVGASFAYQLVDEEGNRAVEMLEEREVNL